MKYLFTAHVTNHVILISYKDVTKNRILTNLLFLLNSRVRYRRCRTQRRRLRRQVWAGDGGPYQTECLQHLATRKCLDIL